MLETWVWSLDQEDPLEKEMAAYSRTLAWENPLGRGDRQATVHEVTYDSATVPPPPKKEFEVWFIFGCAGSLLLSGFSVVVAHRLLIMPHLLWSTLKGSGSVVVPGLSCPVACGIFLEQGSNLWPLHWQVDSQPLDHQRSLESEYFLFTPLILLLSLQK